MRYKTRLDNQATGRCENCGEDADRNELKENNGLCQRCAGLKY